jgi:hypothetical protein
VERLRLRTLRRIIFVIFLALFAAIALRWISLERWHWETTRGEKVEIPIPLPSASPSPAATRAPAISGKFDLPRLFNGITLHTELETVPGGAAADERIDPMSYAIDLKMRARVPTPNRTLDELVKTNAELPTLLPGLPAMVKPETVSSLFAQLYETKVRVLRENLSRLDQLLSRHNFYDCQTILQLRHPESHRRALLLQADMDVDADGSDGDRVPAGNGASPTFKPFTSFRWNKKTNAPNPYLAATEERLQHVETEQKTAPPERKRDLKSAGTELRDEINAMKKFSYLIGTYDPFIVVPGNFTKGGDAVKVGDYAVVIAGNSIYPAIVGDVGPNDKVGEASLRIAKEINALSNPNNRPVSDLKVTYLIFNGTADSSWGPPDLEKLQTRCETFVKEIGGATVPLHHWQNTIPPPPTPTPPPSPPPSPSPAATSTATSPPVPSPSATFAFPTPSPTSSVTTGGI